MAEKLDYTNPCPRCGDAAMPEKYRVLGCAMNYACESMVSTEGLFIAGRPCLLRQLAAANERAESVKRALTLLISDLDKCQTRQRGGGASGQTVENNLLATYITGLPVVCVERAREALEVPDAAND